MDNLYSRWNIKDFNFGCLMLDLDPTGFNYHEAIPESVIYDDGSGKYGIETDPHVTLLYGFINNANDIKDEISHVLDGIEIPSRIKANSFGVFKTSLYDVVHVSVGDNQLFDINRALKRLPHIETFPYIPHATIAYVQPGVGDMAVSYLNNLFDVKGISHITRGLNYGRVDDPVGT